LPPEPLGPPSLVRAGVELPHPAASATARKAVERVERQTRVGVILVMLVGTLSSARRLKMATRPVTTGS
jgi:hypothetical protein